VPTVFFQNMVVLPIP